MRFGNFTMMVIFTPMVWYLLSVTKALCISIPDIFTGKWSVSHPVCETVRDSRFMQQRYPHLWKTVFLGCDSLNFCRYQNDHVCRSSHTRDGFYTTGVNVSDMPQERTSKELSQSSVISIPYHCMRSLALIKHVTNLKTIWLFLWQDLL